MEIGKDLFLAILSMDAYNRKYGAGIALTGSKIGSATIKTDSEIVFSNPNDLEGAPTAAQAAGFYAVAYTVHGVEGIEDGATVVSFRGTDFSPDPGMSDDILKGWPIGGGNYYELQSLLATDFLDAVQADNAPGSVILTGHSLGGGLAGLQSRLFGNEAVVFDPMTYMLAADRLAYFYSQPEGILDSISPALFVNIPTLQELISSYLYANLAGTVDLATDIITVEIARQFAGYIYRESLSPLPDVLFDAGEIALANNTTGYYLPGEVLNSFGWGEVNFSTLRDPSVYSFIQAVGQTNTAENLADVGGTAPAVSLHSMAALILQKFSDDAQLTASWNTIHREVFRAWFGDSVASAIDPKDSSVFVEGFNSGAVLSMIAYSALDSDEGLVFGNTGIRSMFDDLADIGSVYTSERSAGRNGFVDETVALRLCCTNRLKWDSCRESSVVAGAHEQTRTPCLQDQELARIQRCAEAPGLADDLV